MTEKQALAYSIAHWKAILRKIRGAKKIIPGAGDNATQIIPCQGYKKQIKAGSSTCALCRNFYCHDGCPIKRKAGQYCCGTPHTTFVEALLEGNIPAATKAAQAEVEFLESLRQ